MKNSDVVSLPTSDFSPPLTVSHRALLRDGDDHQFRTTLDLMLLAVSRLQLCQQGIGNLIDLTASQFAVLTGVAFQKHAEGITIRELADNIQIASTHVTTEVSRLVQRSLLIKRPSTKDKRSVLIRLTPKGERAIALVAPLIRQSNDFLFEKITRDMFETIRRFSFTLLQNSEYALAEIRRASLTKAEKSHPAPPRVWARRVTLPPKTRRP